MMKRNSGLKSCTIAHHFIIISHDKERNKSFRIQIDKVMSVSFLCARELSLENYIEKSALEHKTNYNLASLSHAPSMPLKFETKLICIITEVVGIASTPLTGTALFTLFTIY
uniref:Uncharacterized protein n=1 Tax=Glossina pallidipes TaxID=7398 RepID=A0A1A9ZE69_GLOPL